MIKFKISRIESGVFAREVNPYGEEPKEPIKTAGLYKYYQDAEVYKSLLFKWQEAESNLQEYPLTGESIEINIGDTVFDHTGDKGIVVDIEDRHNVEVDYNGGTGLHCIVAACEDRDIEDYLSKFQIGQEITGEIVIENGVKKIKI